jgi:protein AbiQ
MQLKKLYSAFYADNKHLVEALDHHNGNWQAGKTRGYGIVIIEFKGLKFAIPLRSHIKHKAAYITARITEELLIKRKGLDYSKALLISQERYISSEVFKIPPEEHNKLLEHEQHITAQFAKYVEHYVKAVSKADKNILQSNEYRYTTLQNYHLELGLAYCTL